MWEPTILLFLISLTFAASCLQKIGHCIKCLRLVDFSCLSVVRRIVDRRVLRIDRLIDVMAAKIVIFCERYSSQ